MDEFEGSDELTRFVVDGLNAIAQSMEHAADALDRLVDIGTAILAASDEPDRMVDGDDE